VGFRRAPSACGANARKAAPQLAHSPRVARSLPPPRPCAHLARAQKVYRPRSVRFLSLRRSTYGGSSAPPCPPPTSPDASPTLPTLPFPAPHRAACPAAWPTGGLPRLPAASHEPQAVRDSAGEVSAVLVPVALRSGRRRVRRGRVAPTRR
jgi:hypothetical protein